MSQHSSLDGVFDLPYQNSKDPEIGQDHANKGKLDFVPYVYVALEIKAVKRNVVIATTTSRTYCVDGRICYTLVAQYPKVGNPFLCSPIIPKYTEVVAIFHQ